MLKMCAPTVFLWALLGSFLPLVLCSHISGEVQYGVILDAGSSGTKLKVYKWQKPKDITEVPIMHLVKTGSNAKFRPDIGHFKRFPEQLPSYLNEIVTKAKEKVPEEARPRTPIYLMATAGARIIEGRIALGLFNRIRNVLSNETINPFRFSGKNVRILSGEEEAVFAWVATNALYGFFNASRPGNESVGLLEMGGGSTQIAFIPSEPLYAGEFQVFIAGRRYDLYVHSFLFYGINYIRQRIRNHLMDIHKGAKILQDPCRLAGDNETIPTKDGAKVTFTGGSNPDECSNILEQFLTKAQGDKCYPKPCSIGSVYQPHVGNTRFYATQSFVYTPQTLRSLDRDTKQLNITQLREEANMYCKMSFNDVLSEYRTSEAYASNECMMGLYFPMLLLDAYQLHPEDTQVTVSSKIHGHRIDWTQGAMLYELNMGFQSRRLMPCTHISRPEEADQPEVEYERKSPAKASIGDGADDNAAVAHTTLLQTLVVSVVVMVWVKF